MWSERDFNGFARRARGRDDDDSTRNRLGIEERVVVGRQVTILGLKHTT